MSLASEVTRNEYIGNGSTSTFSFTFPVFSADDLEVYKSQYTIAAGSTTYVYTESLLVKDTDYTVSLNGTDVGRAWAGSITLTAGALEATVTRLVIRRKQPFKQSGDFKNNPDFYAKAHENVYDKLTMQLQTIEDKLAQAVKLHVTDSSNFTPVIPPGVKTSPSSVIIVNDAGDSFEIGPQASALDDAQEAAALAIAAASAASASAADAATSAAIASAAAASTASSLATIQAIYNAVKFDVTTYKLTSDTTLAAEGIVLRIDPSSAGSGGIVVTLPSASSATDIRIIGKNVTSSIVPITFSAAGSDKIDGDSTLVIQVAYGYAGMVANGTDEWTVIH